MDNQSLQTIVVDLTPILPGGDNGGAKLFVLELLTQLARIAPQTHFILLTQMASHEELACLDQHNVSRRMVLGHPGRHQIATRLHAWAGRLLTLLPTRWHGHLLTLGIRAYRYVQRTRTSALPNSLGADLLFCPFTAPTYADPHIPTVCTIYDLQYQVYPGFFAPEDVAQRAHAFTQASRRATALAAISDFSRQEAIQHGNINPARIRTIHPRMAQRIKKGTKAPSPTIGRLGLVAGRYLLYPANFWKHKNHEMLLTAFGIACRNGLAADIKLVCTGAPSERQSYLAAATTIMNLGGRVIFPGFLPVEELADVMGKASGLIFPSLYEGFGLPVIEAMAAGIPVACGNLTSLPEVAADAAFLFDPRRPLHIANAMITLVENVARRERLIEAGINRAAEYADSERMAREYWDLFIWALTNDEQVPVNLQS